MSSCHILLILTIALVSLAMERHYLHFTNGKMTVNGAEAPIEGFIVVGFDKKRNGTAVAGTYGQKSLAAGFIFESGNIMNFTQSGNTFSFWVPCKTGDWKEERLYKIRGIIRASGDYHTLKYWSNCSSDRIRLEVSAEGHYSQCIFYELQEAAKRAQMLVGYKSDTYRPVEVISYAAVGYPQAWKSCEWFLKHSHNATEAHPGYVIVGKDGKHCAIVDAEGDKFVHAHPTKNIVTLSPMTALPQFFHNGYVFRYYDCALFP